VAEQLAHKKDHSMSDAPLVLSLFPGIGLLDRAFEDEGFTVVRGPDVLWGGDVRRFHPPAGVFSGVIGGPPCQVHSSMAALNPHAGKRHGDLIPEFCRVVGAARPEWFLMENVPGATEPVVEGYAVRDLLLNNRWLGEEQNRIRRFSFGTPGGRSLLPYVEVAVFEAPRFRHAVMAGHGSPKNARMSARGLGDYTVAQMCRLQGLPETFGDELPFTTHGKRRVIGNGVPLPLGRAVARAVKRAMTQANSQ
jgi:DNA (cytosine-5)-methyltransferase 1